ncbi:MAG: hypothetical protein ACO20H_13415 [Bacteriovoracaceae bacterium]
MKKLLLLIAVLGLVSCAGPKGTDGANGADGADAFNATELAVSIINSSPKASLIKKYISTSTSVNDVLSSPSNPNTFIWKDEFTDKFYYVDMTGFTGTLSSEDVMSFVVTNGVEVIQGLFYYTVGGNTGTLSNFRYEDLNGNYYYSEANDSTKDLESFGSNIESVEVNELKENLVNYGLSAERSERVSSLLTSYRKVQNKRGLNKRERDYFTKELLGLSFDEASQTLVNEGMDSLIDSASEVNNADPEAIREIVEELI